MDMAVIQQVAIAFSAIIATGTFVYKVFDDRKSRKEAEILAWQKTVVHSIFQKSKSPWMSFETIIGSYRGEAADVPGRKLPAEILTSAALRKILISMVSERIIDQRGGDEYQLLTFNRDESMDERFNNFISNQVGQTMVMMKDVIGSSQETNRDMTREVFAQLLGERASKVIDNNKDRQS